MQKPLRVTFRHLRPSRELVSLAEKYVNKIEDAGVNVTSCHVVVGLPHRNRRKGKQYRVRVVCSVPGRRATAAASHTVPQVALAEAFRMVRHESMRRRRGRRFQAPRTLFRGADGL